MSVDHNDLADTAQQARQGQSSNFWPIIIDPSEIGVGTEVEININPCDHIWLPTFYDASLGLNPMQVGYGGGVNIGGGQSGCLPFQGPFPTASAGFGIPGNAPFGLNVFDVWDQSNPQGPPTGSMVQMAPVFSLKFNSPNAPWFLWGLGMMLSPDGPDTDAYPPSGGQNAGGLIGMGDLMRSISGPVSRLFYKLVTPAYVYNVATQLPAPYIPASRVVLMSSLGFSQNSIGFAQSAYASSPTEPANAPQLALAAGSYALSGGGYITPQLNTLEQIELEARKIGTRITAEGLKR